MPFGYYEAEITAQAPKKPPKPKTQPVQPPRITNLPKPPAPQLEKPVKIPAPPPVVPAVIGNVMEMTVAVAEIEKLPMFLRYLQNPENRRLMQFLLPVMVKLNPENLLKQQKNNLFVDFLKV